MTGKAKNGIFTTTEPDRIQTVLGGLRAAGFSDEHVSVLVPDAAEPGNLSLSQDARHGAATGGIVGIIAAEFSTIGTIALGGLGSFVVAGPLLVAVGGAAALGGAAAGSAIGGLAGGTGYLARLVGIPSSVVERCEEDLKNGKGLLLVEYRSAEEKQRARQVFAESGITAVYESVAAAEESRP